MQNNLSEKWIQGSYSDTGIYKKYDILRILNTSKQTPTFDIIIVSEIILVDKTL